MHSFQGLCNFCYCLLERKWLNFNIHRNFVQSNYWIFKHVITKARSPKTTTVSWKKDTNTPCDYAGNGKEGIVGTRRNTKQLWTKVWFIFQHIQSYCLEMQVHWCFHFSSLFGFILFLWGLMSANKIIYCHTLYLTTFVTLTVYLTLRADLILTMNEG